MGNIDSGHFFNDRGCAAHVDLTADWRRKEEVKTWGDCHVDLDNSR
jgi:hypothetical protein